MASRPDARSVERGPLKWAAVQVTPGKLSICQHSSRTDHLCARRLLKDIKSKTVGLSKYL
eukprot:5860079-Amphidinium_carterae.1